MSSKVKAAILVPSFLIVVFTVIGGLGVQADTNTDGAYRQLGVYSEVLSRIRSEYVEDPNIPKVTDGALHGMLEALDANSSYMDPTEYKAFKSRKIEGKATVGAAVSKRFGYAAVISVIPGGPADKAGIASGDIIEAIEGKSTREMALAEVHALLQGAPGSNLNVTIVRARRAQPAKVVITRDNVNIPSASEKMLEEGIGYVKLDAFNKGKAQEVANRVKQLTKNGAKKLILDVRDAAEGDMQEAVGVANLFLTNGTIGYLEGQKHPKETYNADPAKAITNLPVIVLVNRGTAGPGELVAAAILENNRGDVLGDKTFGSGSVQKTIELPDGAALILSTAKYYTPGGKALQDTAVTPNILVADQSEDAILPDDEVTGEDPNEPLRRQEKGTDTQLKRAIEVLKNTNANANTKAAAGV